MEEEIKKKNFEINLMINIILSKMKEKDIKAINYENGEPYIQEPAKTILEMELKKILSTYKAEFIQFVDKKKENQLDNASIIIEKGEEVDARGHRKGIVFFSETNKALKNIFEEMRYTITETGAIRYDRDGKRAEKLDCKLIGKAGEKHLLTNEEKIENNLNVVDYFAYASIKDIQDIEFFLDVMPHEAMHVFGFKGGIFEGVTETFTRETAEKYNIRATPFAHNKETKLIQKIEKVIGKNAIAENSYVEDEKGSERYENISAMIDEKLNINKEIKRGLFKNICELDDKHFKNFKLNSKDEGLKEIEKKLSDTYSELYKELDNYIEINPDKLYKLSENNLELNEKEEKAKHKEQENIILIQNNEIHSLRIIIENLEKVSSINNKENGFIEKLKSKVNKGLDNVVPNENKKNEQERSK